MSDKTKIEWTDSTWNPITGCSVKSAGCKHCYAMQLAGTRLRRHPSRAGLTIDTNAGPVWTGEVRFNAQWIEQPLKWIKPRRIFVCAHGDLFHDEVPDEWIDQVFAIMALAPQHTFQVLTKRADRMRQYMLGWPDGAGRIHHVAYQARKILRNKIPVSWVWQLQKRWPLPNVWMGVSAEDQKTAEERVPELLLTPAAVSYISAEPLLGPMNLNRLVIKPSDAPERGKPPVSIDALRGWYGGAGDPARIDWVIAGGESGRNARCSHTDWFRALRDQCASAGVAFFFKQNGVWVEAQERTGTVYSDDAEYGELAAECDGFVSVDGHFVRSLDDAVDDVKYRGMQRVGKKAAGRLLDGCTWDEFPGSLS